MDTKTFLEYLMGNDNLLQFAARNANYVVIKVPFDTDTVALYGNRAYNGQDNRPSTAFYDKLEYYGFFSKKTEQIYDIQYILSETLGILYEERKQKDSIIADLIAALSHSVSTHVEEHLDEFPASCISSRKDVEYMRKHSAPESARTAFFEHKSLNELELQISDRSLNIGDQSVVDFIHRPNELIGKMTADYVEKNREDLAYSVLYHAERKKVLEKLTADTSGIHYKQRRISDAITDQVTVRVGITKDGKDFMFSYAADRIKRHESSFGTWDMAAKDRREFERLFGSSSNFTADEINEILHGKKVLYRA